MIRITVEDKGLKEAKRALDALAKVCTGAGGPNTAELHSKDRKDGSGESNADILEWLTKHKADFVSLTNQADESRVYQPIADYIVLQMQGFLKGAGIDEMSAGAIRGGGLFKGVKAFAELVSERLREQRPASGTLSPPSEDYARQRKAQYGIDEGVVGIASGDLLDNLASGSVRLTRR